MPDDQLQAVLEEVEQADLALRAGEAVVLDDLDHREPAARLADGVALSRERLLLLEQGDAGCAPLVVGHHFGKAHSGTPIGRYGTGEVCMIDVVVCP